MPISCGDLLQVAAGLHALGTEPAMRSGVSRNYYAAFHSCFAWHKSLPHEGNSRIGPQGGNHQQLINALKNPSALLPTSTQQRSKTLGAQLQILRDRRTPADYKLDATLQVAEAENQCLLATKVLAACGAGP